MNYWVMDYNNRKAKKQFTDAPSRRHLNIGLDPTEDVVNWKHHI
jgi:hypothetical protein